MPTRQTILLSRVSLAAVLVLAVVVATAAEPASKAEKPAAKPRKPRVLVTISKETTRITEPLRPDGYPDYIAALNQQVSRGVTPENNASVLFWQATGWPGDHEGIRARYFEMLGVPAPPEEGDYFVELDDYIRRLENPENPEAVQLDPDQQDKLWDNQAEAMGRPWSAKEFPQVAGWLKANQKPLALVVEGSRRPRRFAPLVVGDEDGAAMLIAVLLPEIQTHRDFARALTARAMLRLNEGKVDEAWADILACHRVARLSGQGPTLIDALVGIAVQGIACTADEALLRHARLTAAQAASMEADLRKLPPMGKMVDKIDTAERFMFLDSVTLIAREGVHTINRLSDGSGEEPGRFAKFMMDLATRATIDWDVILRMGNTWYDRMVAAHRLPTRAQRQEAFGLIDDDIQKLVEKARDPKSLAFALLGSPRKAVTQRMGSIFIALLLPAINAASTAEDRGTMQFEVTRLGFPLAAYRADHGAYPAKLADLVPKYRSEVPTDLFTGKPLRYRREGDGYLLYSVGVNGTDDGGRGYDDRDKLDDDQWGDKDWDDLSLRVPAKNKEKKKP